MRRLLDIFIALSLVLTLHTICSGLEQGFGHRSAAQKVAIWDAAPLKGQGQHDRAERLGPAHCLPGVIMPAAPAISAPDAAATSFNVLSVVAYQSREIDLILRPPIPLA